MNKSILDEAGKVVNVIVLADGASWLPPEGFIIGPDGGNVGDVWTGSSYLRAEPPAIE